MPIETIVKEATGLSDSDVEMVVSFIRFLQFKALPKHTGERELGLLADRFEYLSEDFDAPLDDFKDYM